MEESDPSANASLMDRDVCLTETEQTRPAPSGQSIKSMDPPIIFKRKTQQTTPGQSSHSIKSMDPPIIFKQEPLGPSDTRSLALSEHSTDPRRDFKQEPQETDSRPGPREDPDGPQSQRSSRELDAIFMRLEEDILMFVKQQLQKLRKLLASERPDRSPESSPESEGGSREAVLSLTMDFLTRMEQAQLAQRLWDSSRVGVSRNKLKSRLQQRFIQVFEGVAKAGNSAPLLQIYTELYVTQGGAAGVNEEHEVRQIEAMSRNTTETPISCEDIFKQRPDSEETTRAVLTKGVAGVGKTVLTQKFSLDWAEGRANQDIQLLFPFTFRELNVLRDSEFSLVGLLHHCFSETKGLSSFEGLQVLFIFDGLDECRLLLDFSRTRVLTEDTESASVQELLVNLIRGSLLPSARLWITTRPAAANQIPAECVSMVTEVRGFANPQKEQYFMKRFRDEQQATAVISHIRSIRSLYIMCHIPVFCWILSTVLQIILKQITKPELPKTLTEMYVHFLVVQAKVKNIKYHEGTAADFHWTPETREMVWSLSKLAFEQLQKGNLIFYESDLRECGLNTAAASLYSGVFTEVFREEPGLYQDKVYCFIHLSVQEFLAALHIHETFFSTAVNLLSSPLSSEGPGTATTNSSEHASKKSMFKMFKRKETKPTHTSESNDPVTAFYCSAVDQALQSPNGHLDLLVRFLLGLSLPTNQRLLSGLLNQTESEGSNQDTIKCIHKRLDNKGLSTERRLNLLHCLSELNDRSLVERIQSLMKEGDLSWLSSPSHWSAVSFILLSSDSELEEFDLRKYQASEKALLNLLPVVKASTNAILSSCGLSHLSCAPLASVLSSSSLTHLDLSNNDLQDSGVELLCEGLKSAPCRLHTVRLSGCMVSERGGASLASALSSVPSRLSELDLSYNHPGSSAALLTALRDDPLHALRSLRLDPAGECWMVPGLRKYSCDFRMDPNTVNGYLLLSEDGRTVTRVEEQQQNPHHEHRFTRWDPKVLCSTALRGRCYCEVDWNRRGGVNVAVTYRRRSRAHSEENYFGNNDYSWCLMSRGGHYSVRHKGRGASLSVYPSSWRVAVFLDTEAGALSFFEVLPDGDLCHLHTFVTTFTEPLFLGFELQLLNSKVTLVNLN